MAGNIKGITIQFDADITPFDKAIRNMEKNISKFDRELRQINNALKFNPTSVDLWRQKQQILTQKIEETRNKLESLKDQQKAMDAVGVDKNSEEYRKLQREIIETESKLKSFEAQLKAIGNVNLRALGEQFKQIGDKMTNVGKNMTTKVTAPLAAIGTVAVSKFAEVDKTMQLTNSTMGNTAQEAQLLDQAMKSAAAASTYGMADAATATLNFARAGLSAQEAADALAPAMALAAGEGGELDTVSSGLVATINGFHGSFSEAGTYADVFANACNNSALDVNSLSNAMSVAAPIFSAAGYKVNDAALYMGVMANNGIDADKAANSLKTGLARLVSPASDGAQMMEKLGISVTNADGTMKDSVQIQEELHNAFGKLSESEQIAAASAIFGKNQMAPWLALINTAPGDVTKLNEALAENGTAMNMQGAMMSGFAGSIEQLKSGLDVLATSLGQALAPMIQKVVSFIQTLVNWFNALSPQAQTIIATIGLIAAAIGPILVILGTLASSIGSIISLIGIVGPLIAGLTAPIGIAVAVIGVLIAAGIALYQNWDTIKQYAGILKDWLIQTWNAIMTGVTNTVNALKTGLTSAWSTIKTTVSNLATGIKDNVVSIWNSLKSRVLSVVNTLKSSLSSSWNSIKSTASSVWNGIKSAIIEPIQTAKETILGIIDTIKSKFPVNIGKVFKFKLPHVDVGSKTVKVGDKEVQVPTFDISWHAAGGIFDRPTLLMGADGRVHGVGEAGPEAILPLNELWKHMAEMNQGVTINVYASQGMDVNELAVKIEQRLVMLQKQRAKAYGSI